MTSPNFYAQKDDENIFRVGWSHGSRNGKVMSLHTGGAEFDVPANSQEFILSANLNMYK